MSVLIVNSSFNTVTYYSTNTTQKTLGSKFKTSLDIILNGVKVEVSSATIDLKLCVYRVSDQVKIAESAYATVVGATSPFLYLTSPVILSAEIEYLFCVTNQAGSKQYFKIGSGGHSAYPYAYTDGILTLTEPGGSYVADGDIYPTTASSILVVDAIDYDLANPKMKVNIGGAWKDYASGWVNIGGVWKKIDKVSVNVGGVWKQS